MNAEGRISELRRRHKELSDRVETIERAPSVDSSEVTTLKKQKLQLKQEISRLS